nr:exosome component 2 [Haemonchus contortus]
MSVVITGPPTTRVQNIIPRAPRGDVVHCGQPLSFGTDVMSGHGTIPSGDNLMASVSGVKMQYSRLFLVEPYKSKYIPKIGDVVVGRIASIQRARWKVDINYRMAAILHLNNVNLPGGELRRKGLEDEVAMSKHLVVGDMVSAEVQQIRMRGQLQLHTRNMKYGKLGQGIMIKVPPNLVKPQKEYMHEIYGVSVIIGCNGIIWISPALNTNPDGGYNTDSTSVLPLDKRQVLVRIAACVRLLAKNLIAICDVSLMSAYSVSLTYKVKDMAHPEISSVLVPRITELIEAEEKRRALEKDRAEAARKRRAI